MEMNYDKGVESDDKVSCFKLDGVVAEMVIEVDDENESPQKVIKLNDFDKLKEKNSSNNTNVLTITTNLTPQLNTLSEKDDSISTLEKIRNNDELQIEQKIIFQPEKDNQSNVENISQEEKPPAVVDSERTVSKITDSNSLKEEEIKKSIFSELDQIRKAAKLIGESKDEIMKFAKLIEESKEDSTNPPQSTKKVPPSKSFSGSKEINEDTSKLTTKSNKLPIEKETLENILPTAVSTRGNKRKLVDIESGFSTQNIAVSYSERKKENVTVNLKPKVFDLFKKDSSLEKFTHFKKSLNEVDLKFQRHFYRVLFDKWAPSDINKMKTEILKFKGFPFKKHSEEEEKRKHILKKLPDLSIAKICKMLDLPVGKRDKMIYTILKFLLKPSKTIISVVNPFQDSMQPFVKLEKLSFEDKYFAGSENKCFNSKLNKSSTKPLALKDELLKTTKNEEIHKNKVSLYVTKRAYNKKNKTPSTTVPKITVCEVVVKEKKKRGRKKKISNLNLLMTQEKKTSDLKVASSIASKRESSIPIIDITASSDNKPENVCKTDPFHTRNASSKKMASNTNWDSPVKETKKAKIIEKPESESKEQNKPQSEENSARQAKQVEAKQEQKRTSKVAASVNKKAMKNRIKKLKKEIAKLKHDALVQLMHDKNSVKAKEFKQSTPVAPVFSKEEEKKEFKKDEIINSTLHKATLSPQIIDEKISEDYSSEVTLSAEETNEEMKKRTKKKRKLSKGKPLRSFPNIKNSIVSGSFSALQRLHILLFGASDKPQNVKANILAFGGFPFLEGSDEWKQKKFLLSLLSLSTLKEYLTLLCMDHSDDDQQTLADKLMKFLSDPSDPNEKKQVDENILEMKTKVVHSELVEPPIQPIKIQSNAKKKVKKPEKKGLGSRNRKVLMSEEQVRRLEADIAREQRILEREKRQNENKLHANQTLLTPAIPNSTTLRKVILQDTFLNQPQQIIMVPQTTLTQTANQLNSLNMQKILPAKPNQTSKSKKAAPPVVKQTDAEQLDALLQTVYQRRVLKASGAVISTPNKGVSTKLGELPNVKFLVVTSNYSDLDVLHHLIYMTDATKSKVRKNILDFSGFGFNEDSSLYKDRMEFLNSLGYDISKRIAFLLGLCPFKTNIVKQDLNELIMYFLMSPCKTKQVPITHLPQTFFSNEMPQELCSLLQKHSDIEVSSIDNIQNKSTISNEKKTNSEKELSITKKIETNTPAVPVPTLSTKPGQKAKKSFKSSCLPPAKKKMLSPSISTIPFKSAKPVKNIPASLREVPSPTLTPAAKSLQKAILQSVPLTQSASTPQELFVQQQTPDGKQKTYKLIKLSNNHPLTSVLKPQTELSQSLPPIIQTQPVSFNSPLASLPPGIIIFKNKTESPSTATPIMPSFFQNAPIVLGQPQTTLLHPVILPNSPATPVSLNNTELNQPEKTSTNVSAESTSSDNEIEILETFSGKPPTDEELFSSIQEIIHSANIENITLRNVIDQVTAKYSNFDLSSRHAFMKECVKKIILTH